MTSRSIRCRARRSRQAVFERGDVVLVEHLRLLVAAGARLHLRRERARWSCGSVSSEKAFATSQPLT